MYAVRYEVCSVALTWLTFSVSGVVGKAWGDSIGGDIGGEIGGEGGTAGGLHGGGGALGQPSSG